MRRQPLVAHVRREQRDLEEQVEPALALVVGATALILVALAHQ